MVFGGLTLGVVVGYIVSLALSRVNDYLVETAMTVVVAYGTYLLAERVGVSGVIAVVVAGLVVGNVGRTTAMSPSTRVAVASSWEFFGFLANSLLFLLIGLELNIQQLGEFWVPTVLAIASVLVVRVVVVSASSVLLRYIHRPIPLSWQIVLTWGGLRGSLALAMALSLPAFIAPGEPFPDHNLLQVATFGVIIFSLLVQGLSIEPLLARLGLISRHTWQEEYGELAVRKGMAAAAMAEVERMVKTGGLSPDAANQLKESYQSHIESLDRDLNDLNLRDEDLRREHMRAVKRHLLQIEKGVVRQRNLDGVIAEETMRQLIGELDSQLLALDQGEDVAIPAEPNASAPGAVRSTVDTQLT